MQVELVEKGQVINDGSSGGDIKRSETVSSLNCGQPTTDNIHDAGSNKMSGGDEKQNPPEVKLEPEEGEVSISPEKLATAVEDIEIAHLEDPNCPVASQTDTKIGLSADEETEIKRLIVSFENGKDKQERIVKKMTCGDSCSTDDRLQKKIDVVTVDDDGAVSEDGEQQPRFEDRNYFQEQIDTRFRRKPRKKKKSKINRIYPNTPMNDANGPFYIDRSVVPVFIYRDGLRDKRWNPTQVLYEICSQCEWTPPEFNELNRNARGFLFSVKVQGQTFTPKMRGWTKKQAKHYASSHFLNFIGFRFRFDDIKSNSWSTVVGSTIDWKNIVKKENPQTVETEAWSDRPGTHVRIKEEKIDPRYGDITGTRELARTIKKEFDDNSRYGAIKRSRSSSCSSECSSVNSYGGFFPPGSPVPLGGSHYGPSCSYSLSQRHRPPSSRSSSPDFF